MTTEQGVPQAEPVPDAAEAQPVESAAKTVPFCDLVMKGGITSGVVFPRLIARLSSVYRFRNIGGTSAGAIAAGACAAAQYGVNKGKNPQAFETLAKLPGELGARMPGKGKGKEEGPSKLLSLFQPTPTLRPHFAVLMRVLNKSALDACLAFLVGLLGMQKKMLLSGLLLCALLQAVLVAALVPASGHLMHASLGLGMVLLAVAPLVLSAWALPYDGRVWHVLFLLLVFYALACGMLMMATGQAASAGLAVFTGVLWVVMLLFLGVWLLLLLGLFASGLLRGLHGNHYGICSGKTENTSAAGTDDGPAGLTDWLTAYLNTLAGLNPTGKPLNFADLWGHNNPDNPERDINLEVVTTAISQQMVYGIPFRPGTAPFYYDREEWRRLFPKSVMDALDACQTDGDTTQAVQNAAGKQLQMLPRDGQMPVVVALRMSLSFPLLLSAVPLYSVDWSLGENDRRKQNKTPQLAKRVWFSDGGLGSNLPLHMFDNLLPGHPTFAVNLKSEHPDYPIKTPEISDNNAGRIYLPTDNKAGLQRFWPEPDDKKPLGGLLTFLSSIINTMQNWRDEIMFPYPGFRDRIVQISLKPDEGGLNLNMPEPTVTTLGKAGEMAAQRLIDRFHATGAARGLGWRQHQQVRLKTLLGTLQPAAADMAPDLNPGGVWTSVMASINTYSSAEHQLADDFLAGLDKLSELDSADQVSLGKSQATPKPLGKLGIRPRI